MHSQHWPRVKPHIQGFLQQDLPQIFGLDGVLGVLALALNAALISCAANDHALHAPKPGRRYLHPGCHSA
jgi:hypothetical protein